VNLPHDSDSDHNTIKSREEVSDTSCRDPTPTQPPPVTLDKPNLQQCRNWVTSWLTWADIQNQSKIPSQTEPLDDVIDGKSTPILDCCPTCDSGNAKKLPDETWMLDQFLADPAFAEGWDFIPKSDVAETDLLTILGSVKGCPLYLYDRITRWASTKLQSESAAAAEDNIIPLLRTRTNCLAALENSTNMFPMKPVTTIRVLKATSGTVSLTKVPFLPSVYHMLTNHDIVKDSSFLFPGGSPHSDPPKKPTKYRDLDTGSAYLDAHYHLKKDIIDLPIGIVTFTDSSVYDKGDRLSTDMVAFTLALFNRETRYKPEAWGALGSVPNFKSVDHKCR
jgi:hypothetical protein